MPGFPSLPGNHRSGLTQRNRVVAWSCAAALALLVAWSCAAALALLVACSGGPAPGSGRSAPPSAGGASSGACLATPAPPQPAAGVSSRLPVWTVLGSLNQPDDLLFHSGELLIGELGTGRIHVVAPGKADRMLPVTIPRIEGMAYIEDTLYVSDQQNDRVDAVDGSSVRTLLQLQPVAGQDGVDNIAAAGRQLLVPDSPRGVLAWVGVDGRVTRSAGGFSRPTGAWPLPDGSVLVADEYGNAAVRVSPTGLKNYLVRGLPLVDDIAADPLGHVFVVTAVVTGGRLAELVDGSVHDVATSLAAPQGLAFDSASNIFVSESHRGRVDLVVRTFKLQPTGPAHLAANQPLCVRLTRAPGFTASVQLHAGSGLRVIQQPGSGSQSQVLASGCAPIPCLLTATAGPYSDQLWISPR